MRRTIGLPAAFSRDRAPRLGVVGIAGPVPIATPAIRWVAANQKVSWGNRLFRHGATHFVEPCLRRDAVGAKLFQRTDVFAGEQAAVLAKLGRGG
jgi:hypothetical protein